MLCALSSNWKNVTICGGNRRKKRKEKALDGTVCPQKDSSPNSGADFLSLLWKMKDVCDPRWRCVVAAAVERSQPRKTSNQVPATTTRQLTATEVPVVHNVTVNDLRLKLFFSEFFVFFACLTAVPAEDQYQRVGPQLQSHDVFFSPIPRETPEEGHDSRKRCNLSDPHHLKGGVERSEGWGPSLEVPP